MGVVDFDPEKWRQANASVAPADVAKVAKVAEVGADWPKLSQLSQLSQVAPMPLAPAIRDGLILLRSMRTPRLAQPDRWPVAVADALLLARDGWVAKALALGWSPIDLFGAVPDADGDPAGDGLAVWLAGRKLLALTANYAVVDDGNGGRAFFNRREAEGAVLLWSFGRGR
jgi:hypothetical protein